MADAERLNDLLIVMAVTTFMVFLCIFIHYECLNIISKTLSKLKALRHRWAMLLIITGVFIAHTLEVWAYAVAYYVVLNVFNLGDFATFNGIDIIYDFYEYLYFSSVTYTSLGFGDLAPLGAPRLLAGVEALNGLLLIGWSASYTYIYMSKVWKINK